MKSHSKNRRPFAPGQSVEVFRTRLRQWIPARFVRYEGALAVVQAQGAEYIERLMPHPSMLRDARQGGLDL